MRERFGMDTGPADRRTADTTAREQIPDRRSAARRGAEVENFVLMRRSAGERAPDGCRSYDRLDGGQVAHHTFVDERGQARHVTGFGERQRHLPVGGGPTYKEDFGSQLTL